MAAAFGISFGASSTCLAVHKDGKTDIIANDAGDRTTPAIIAFTDHDKVVGLAAKHALLRNSQNTVRYVKQILGITSFDDPRLQAVIENSPVKIVNKDGRPQYQVSYKNDVVTVSPESIAQDLFQNLQELAQHHGECDLGGGAVVAVPTDFTAEQKACLSRAAEKGGFHVLRVISEPAAAALAYDIGQSERDCCNVLILRMGDTTSEASVLAVSEGLYRILCSCRSAALGGMHFTDAIVQHFATEFKRLHRADLRENKRSLAKLAGAAELCKHVLSALPSGNVSVESLHEGIDFQSNIARASFEILSSKLLAKCQSLLEEALQASALAKSDVHRVVLCGGTARIPCIQKLVADFLPDAMMHTSIPCDEVIALGAAKQAAILVGHADTANKDLPKLFNCISREIGVKIDKGDYTKILSKLTPFPVRVKRKFPLACDSCDFELHVSEYNEENKAHRALGKVSLSNLKEDSAIDVIFQIDNSGSLEVLCHESGSDQRARLTVPSASQEE